METTTRKPQGFATMAAKERREIASRGGKAVHAKGTGRVWSVEGAREAGRKGGLASAAKRAARATAGA